MYAFGLTQTGQLDKAEENAKKGIDLNDQVDGWATHALCHVYEYRPETAKGIKFLIDTESNWTKTLMSNHNYWHLCLYYIEQNEHDKCIDVIEQKLNSPQAGFDMIDLVSLLLRLRLDNYQGDPKYIQHKYEALKRKFVENLTSHGFLFHEYHK
jgi:hypothetical protein